ncbi:MAG: putative DNA binding domain-containing protein [Flexilinea sp.]|nr:putative DNA binding domain-containing protein [Flexilinea sp.]
MIYRESETTELKSIVTDDIKKEIIAFANSEGGKIYIGINDEGSVCGISDPDGAALQISNMIRDNIRPDLSLFVHYETVNDDGKDILVVTVQRGTERPYYLSGKGLKPSGVYIRQGFSSAPASDFAIRRMIKDTDGDSFEIMRSMNQDLSFLAADKEFELRKISFGDAQKKTLGVIGQDGLFTNLALLLSDQCPHTIKAAVFEGTEQDRFKNRKEFTGSIFDQMNDAYSFIDFYNENRASFDKLYRIDHKSYPETALREALLNCLVHREYGINSSTLISIYSNRIEFTSIGGLLPGLTIRDIMMGISACRNPKLANVFYRLSLIEAYGTGIRKILGAYQDHPVKPTIETSENVFKVILPNTNEIPTQQTEEKKALPNIEGSAEKIIKYLHENGSINRRDVERLLNTSQASGGRLLKQMVSLGKLEQYGSARSTRYRLR